MAPAGLGSAKTSRCRKPLKHVLCYKQRWKTEAVFPDKRWMDADGFVSSCCPLRGSLDFRLLPAGLQPRPAEGFIACTPSEESPVSTCGCLSVLSPNTAALNLSPEAIFVQNLNPWINSWWPDLAGDPTRDTGSATVLRSAYSSSPQSTTAGLSDSPAELKKSGTDPETTGIWKIELALPCGWELSALGWLSLPALSTERRASWSETRTRPAAVARRSWAPCRTELCSASGQGSLVRKALKRSTGDVPFVHESQLVSWGTKRKKLFNFCTSVPHLPKSTGFLCKI